MATTGSAPPTCELRLKISPLEFATPEPNGVCTSQNIDPCSRPQGEARNTALFVRSPLPGVVCRQPIWWWTACWHREGPKVYQGFLFSALVATAHLRSAMIYILFWRLCRGWGSGVAGLTCQPSPRPQVLACCRRGVQREAALTLCCGLRPLEVACCFGADLHSLHLLHSRPVPSLQSANCRSSTAGN